LDSQSKITRRIEDSPLVEMAGFARRSTKEKGWRDSRHEWLRRWYVFFWEMGCRAEFAWQ
jgi:hypothetical protein